MITTSNIIDPRMIPTAMLWCDYSAALIQELGVVPEKLLSESSWQEWAAHVLMYPDVSKLNAPNPYQFNSWREWAILFNQAVSAG